MNAFKIRLLAVGDPIDWERYQDFSFRSYALFDFVNRRLRENESRVESCSELRLLPCAYDDTPWYFRDGLLHVTVPIDLEEYSSLGRDEFQEYFIGFVERGLMLAPSHISIPTAPIREAIGGFRASGYTSSWLAKRAYFVESEIEVHLCGTLDMCNFRLFVEARRKGECVFREQAFRTEPDELMYAWRYESVQLQDDRLCIVDRVGRPMWSKDLSGLLGPGLPET